MAFERKKSLIRKESKVKTAEKFKKVGYIVVRDLIDAEDLYKYALKKMDKWEEDKWVQGSPYRIIRIQN